jgi:hypothetical protein
MMHKDDYEDYARLLAVAIKAAYCDITPMTLLKHVLRNHPEATRAYMDKCAVKKRQKLRVIQGGRA